MQRLLCDNVFHQTAIRTPMPTRRSSPAKPESPILTLEQLRRRIERLQKCIDDLEAFDPQTIRQRDAPEVMGLETAIDGALEAAFGVNTPAYLRFCPAATLDNGARSVRMAPNWAGGGFAGVSDALAAQETRQYLADGKQQSIVLLRQAIRAVEDEIADRGPGDHPSLAPAIPSPARNRKVFVVHGHDEGALQAVARFLDTIGLKAIVLREQPDQGRTIIEKFEAYAREVGFAVVLLTPDDLGGAAATAAQAARARQNVIFELGYFVGSLGRGRACLLRKGDVEIPSDLFGVIYSDFDHPAESWKVKLARELKAGEFEFDRDKVLG
jgi:predicted nucleotide-binding protein